jgi:hypothetical protein
MKNLIISFSFICIAANCTAQKWYSITKNDIGIIVCEAIAGTADAYHERIANHKLGQGNAFWDASVSWKNKYKNWDAGDKRAAFIGSKTWLVCLTDGYHLTRQIDRNFTLATIALAAHELHTYNKKDRWKVVLKKVLLSAIANRITFNIIYK